MTTYTGREALMTEIQTSAERFLREYDDVSEQDMDLRLEGVDRTPREILAYQLGWIGLMLGWDRDEQAGKEVVTPAPGYKWNQMGGLYQQFYQQYADASLAALLAQFTTGVEGLIAWVGGFSEEELFQPGGRRWAQSTPSNWPVWKWVHINTVAPYQSFRSKLRKWKKLRAAG